MDIEKPRTSFTFAFTPEQIEQLKSYLSAHDYEFKQPPYTHFVASRKSVSVSCYHSGKVLVQGKESQELVEFVIEPEILKSATIGYEEQLNPELLTPRIGVDESGKGDYFGPLCIASVYVNPSVLAAWKNAGIRDSKRIGSTASIQKYAKLIRETRGCVYSVVAIGNPAYNRLYEKMANVNRILAWGHARVIENLLEQKAMMNPPPQRAIIDQFARSKNVVASALLSLGQNLELVQRHKAEEDLAVAAASILARARFVDSLANLGKTYGMVIPKGASTAADTAAMEFIAKHGRDQLGQIAKLHFKNTQNILS